MAEKEQSSLNFDYTEEELFDRCYHAIEEKKSTIENVKRKKVTPIFEKQGRKTKISNFKEVCEVFNRPTSDVQMFLQKELGIESSITESGAILLNKIYHPRQVNPTIDKYEKLRVLCKQCKSSNTTIKKESKVSFIDCSSCNSKNAIE